MARPALGTYSRTAPRDMVQRTVSRAGEEMRPRRRPTRRPTRWGSRLTPSGLCGVVGFAQLTDAASSIGLFSFGADRTFGDRNPTGENNPCNRKYCAFPKPPGLAEAASETGSG